MSAARSAGAADWLLLIHQIPPKPDYFRVKVRRRLHQLGAMPIKSSVYALPATQQAAEDFAWLAREIEDEGGDAAVCRATFISGLGDEELRDLFRAARDADYGEVAAAARTAAAAGDPVTRAAELQKLRARLARLERIDHFGARGRGMAEEAVAAAQRSVREPASGDARVASSSRSTPGTTWVTRRDVHVDRIASAWLIRRFIDPKARFAFVAATDARPKKGQVRFDMFDAEYTHENGGCTFETLLVRFNLRDRALSALG